MSDKSPWVSIWCNPRATIRLIVAKDPDRSIWILGAIYGFLSFLNSFQSIAVGSVLGIIPILLIALALSPVLGFSVFSIWSWVVYQIGRLFKGVAHFKAVRAAFAWSCVPLAVNIALWFLMIFVFGLDFFFSEKGYLVANAQAAFLLFVLMSKVVIAIWSLVIYLNALAEVQQLSMLCTIISVVISWIVVGVVLGVFWFLLLYLS